MGFRQWHFGITKAGDIFHYVPEQSNCHISYNTLEACICQAFAASLSSPVESTLLHRSFSSANHQLENRSCIFLKHFSTNNRAPILKY
jgi:hypothetical protein